MIKMTADKDGTIITDDSGKEMLVKHTSFKVNADGVSIEIMPFTPIDFVEVEHFKIEEGEDEDKD